MYLIGKRTTKAPTLLDASIEKCHIAKIHELGPGGAHVYRALELNPCLFVIVIFNFLY